MIQINIGDHSGFEDGIECKAIPPNRRHLVTWARAHAFRVARGNPRANRYFQSLPKRQSLSTLLRDRSIWINYNPRRGYYGFTRGKRNLWLCDGAFVRGRWTVLATIIHELAHINGAMGAIQQCTTSSQHCHAAERAVLECGLGYDGELRTGQDDPHTPYDPLAFG